ncbi:MAG: VOC family protein [Myxococcota bacterium]|nr:VOC family protein [Myxococcota bacterium]
MTDPASRDTSPFHLAIAVHDLELAREFYGGVLGCSEGRSAPRWVDFDMFGHQLSVHLGGMASPPVSNPVDGDSVPVPHFGVILPWEQWHELADRLKAAEHHFLIGPRTRFAGEPGEQATMFFQDPSGNHLEFKSFKDPSRVFAT